MECPHCNYKSGWDPETLKFVEGEDGDFFTISNAVRMERDSTSYHYEKSTRTVYGCPSCNKLFMENF